MRISKIVFIISTLLLTSVAHAAGTKIEGLPIKIGDTIEDVQKAFDTKLEPEQRNSENPLSKLKKQTELHLKTKGVWIFFEKGKAVTIRVDPPFSGNVGGIKLGDPSSKIEKTLGPATKHGTFGTSDTYTYYFDDITTTRFDINRDDVVETIFFFK
jgi:hypothetical protein